MDCYLVVIASSLFLSFSVAAAPSNCPEANCSALGPISCRGQKGLCFWSVKTGLKRWMGHCIPVQNYNCSLADGDSELCSADNSPERCTWIPPLNQCMDTGDVPCTSFGKSDCYRLTDWPSTCGWDETMLECRRAYEIPCNHFTSSRGCNFIFPRRCEWIPEDSTCVRKEPEKPKLNFTTIKQGDNAVTGKPRQFTFWVNRWPAQDFWKRLHSNVHPIPELPNFEPDNLLVGVFLKVPTTGYSVTIKTITNFKDVRVMYEVQKPSIDMSVQNTTTYPFHMVQVQKPKKFKKTRFINLKPIRAVPFTSIEKGDISGFGSRRKMVIREAEWFGSFWMKHKSLSSPVPHPPQIDFSRNMVLAAFFTSKPWNIQVPTIDYSLEILSVEERSKSVVVKYGTTKVDPETTCRSPHHVVQVERIDKPVKFVLV